MPGFELKEAIKAFLTSENREVLDVGTHSKDPVDYPDFAEAVGPAVRDARAERGIIICGSGVGARWPPTGSPASAPALCHDTYSAHQGVEHDDMNVLVLGGRVVGVELARELMSRLPERALHRRGRHVQPRSPRRRRWRTRCGRSRCSASRCGSTTCAAA